ncbi:MAG: hypothetical protein ACJAYV_002370 [Oleispira sp.]|jgi:hypothetical protein
MTEYAGMSEPIEIKINNIEILYYQGLAQIQNMKAKKHCIELEYMMSNGKLDIPCRAAQVKYLLKWLKSRRLPA